MAGRKANYLEVLTHSFEKTNGVWSDANIGLGSAPIFHLHWYFNVVGFVAIFLAMQNRLVNIDQ